jgi:hypothetical protein
MLLSVVRSVVPDVLKDRSAFIVRGQEVAEGERTTFIRNVEEH